MERGTREGGRDRKLFSVLNVKIQLKAGMLRGSPRERKDRNRKR